MCVYTIMCVYIYICARVCVFSWLLSHKLGSLIQGTVLQPVEFYQKVEGNGGAWGKAVATIDASVARVFADMWCLNSHESMKNYVEKQGPDALRKVVRIEDSHSMIYVNLVRLGMGVSDRVFATWFTWRKEPDNSFLVAWTPLEDYAVESADALEQVKNYMTALEERRERDGEANDVNAFRRDTEDLKLMMQQIEARKMCVNEVDELIMQDPIASSAIRGSSRGFFRFKSLAPSVCQVTYIVQAELGGSIPTALLNSQDKKRLSSVQTMQVKFERNGKLVDKEMLGMFASPPPLAELSKEQMSVVEDCGSLESEDGREWETLSSPSPFVTMWMKHAPAKENERSIAIGKATAVIDCPVHEALGESSDACARREARLA